jgi:hypothetical protein
MMLTWENGAHQKNLSDGYGQQSTKLQPVTQSLGTQQLWCTLFACLSKLTLKVSVEKYLSEQVLTAPLLMEQRQ